MQNKELPDIGVLEDQVAEMRERIGGGVSTSDDRGKRLSEIEIRLADARRGDAAAAHSAAAQIGPLLDSIEAESSSELLDNAIRLLNEAESWAHEVVDEFGTTEDRRALQMLVDEAHGSVSKGNHRDVDQRRDRIIGHTWLIILRQPGFWIEEFTKLSAKAASSTDPVAAGSLIQKGRGALDRQDMDGLMEVVRALWQLFPDSSNAMMSYGIRAVS